MNDNCFTVYMHKNKENGKIYIGITKRKPEQRWKNGLGYRHNRFRLAINKYGWDNFEHIIIKDGLSEEEARKLETELILKYKSYDRNFGYNETYGGEHNIPTDETKDKISKSMKGKFDGEKNPFFGMKHTDETKKIISEKAKERLSNPENNPFYGKHHSEETKKIISEKHKDFVLSEEHKEKLRRSRIGRHCSEEHKQKLRELKTGVKRPDMAGENNPFSKKVVCCETGKVYSSIKQASEENGCIVKSALSGKATQAGGLHWLYYDDYRTMFKEDVKKYVEDCIRRSHKKKEKEEQQ